ncbi:MAG: hypothetical protein D6803_01630 [Anaerolineae bacterium]|nr:MAG: hypothetical protein D6803_01630 [Anaerolineae bacterium]
MKSRKTWMIIGLAMMLTLLTVSTVLAAPAEKGTRPPVIPVPGPGMYVMNAAAYPPAPMGYVNYSVVFVTAPGTLCFINPYDSVRDFGHIKKPAIRKLDNGKWTSNALPERRTEVSVAQGYQRCAEVGVGIWAFQGMGQ